MADVQFMVSYSGTDWVKCKARTLKGAKRSAKRNCPFQGYTLWVGVLRNSGSLHEAVHDKAV